MPVISVMNVFRECHRGKHIYSELVSVLAKLSLIKRWMSINILSDYKYIIISVQVMNLLSTFQKDPPFVSIGMVCATGWHRCLLVIGRSLAGVFIMAFICMYSYSDTILLTCSTNGFFLELQLLLLFHLSVWIFIVNSILQIRRRIVQLRWLTRICWPSWLAKWILRQ